MSRAFRENQVDQIAKVIRENSKPEDRHLAAPLAHKIYDAGARIVPMWVMVIWATLYNWWWILLIEIGCIIYYLIFMREEMASNHWSITAPAICFAGIIMFFYATYRELKTEIRMNKQKKSPQFRDTNAS